MDGDPQIRGPGAGFRLRFVPFLVLAGLIVEFGCDHAAHEPRPPDLDREFFQSRVEPILTSRCANPTSCHGQQRRPFTLFARGAHRIEREHVYLDPPLSETEHRLNFDRARGFALPPNKHAELLAKPLATEAGGMRHEPEPLFQSKRNAEFQTILSWVRGAER